MHEPFPYDFVVLHVHFQKTFLHLGTCEQLDRFGRHHLCGRIHVMNIQFHVDRRCHCLVLENEINPLEHDIRCRQTTKSNAADVGFDESSCFGKVMEGGVNFYSERWEAKFSQGIHKAPCTVSQVQAYHCFVKIGAQCAHYAQDGVCIACCRVVVHLDASDCQT